MYLQFFNTQNYILLKISALGLFLKYSENFANFRLDILIKYILIQKKECIAGTSRKGTPFSGDCNRTFHSLTFAIRVNLLHP